jgi:predicted Holliday junction resolvase-like endonuclease
MVSLGAIAKYFAGRAHEAEDNTEVQKVIMEYNHRNDMLRKELMYNDSLLKEELEKSKKELERRLSELRKNSIDDNSSSYDVWV